MSEAAIREQLQTVTIFGRVVGTPELSSDHQSTQFRLRVDHMGSYRDQRFVTRTVLWNVTARGQLARYVAKSQLPPDRKVCVIGDIPEVRGVEETYAECELEATELYVSLSAGPVEFPSKETKQPVHYVPTDEVIGI